MRNSVLTIFVWMFFINGFAQRKHVYLFPGLGADGALFSKTVLLNCDTTIVRLPTPGKKETLEEYAKRISAQIDTTRPFSFIGVSLGGMLAVEIAKDKKPEKIILVSSAKNRGDLPARYKFQRVIPMYAIFSGRFYKRMTKFARPIVERDSRPYDSLFNAMIDRKNPKFMKRSIKLICCWKNKEENKNIIHIHGANDHTLPYRHIQHANKVEKGSHMMIYTKSEELNLLLNASLQNNN